MKDSSTIGEPDTARPGGGGTAVHPLARCLAAVQAELAAVVDAPSWSLSAPELAALNRQSAQALAGLTELHLRLVAAADHAEVASTRGAVSTTSWLAAEQRVTYGEACAQVRLADALDSECEATRRALAAGSISSAQAQVIVKALAMLPKELGPQERAQAEEWLLDQARSFGPDELRRLGRRVWEVLDPDGVDEREGKALEAEEAEARRTATLVMRRRGDGSTAGRFRIPDAHADLLRHWLEAASAPRRRSPATDPDTADDEEATYPVRLGRALMTLAEHLPTTGFASAGAVPATVAVTIDWDRLRAEVGAASLSTGTPLSASLARRLACNAGLLPLILDGASRVLDAGTSQRLFDRYQRQALAVRDRGCIWPGCDRPPAWCEAHHLTAWSKGGPTDLCNGCLLCVPHHHLAHQGEWSLQMAPDGVPEVVPPARLDPLRRRRRHERFRCRAPD